MPRFQWYSRSDIGWLVGIPLYASAYYFSMRLLWDNHFLLGTAVMVLGFQAADWLKDRTMIWFSPALNAPSSDQNPSNS
ncbi:hypothetical protein [Planctellipticum variicoloris]|uniref:hypothetical protein n=1 Tax=Planctellipticum variicoloris TaxID=3064265 RepID=UPI00301390A1|nr:hypothetical protein SH412_002510 [Planctomycetaceae bacterium SH412]